MKLEFHTETVAVPSNEVNSISFLFTVRTITSIAGGTYITGQLWMIYVWAGRILTKRSGSRYPPRGHLLRRAREDTNGTILVNSKDGYAE
ncbi:hypothetical protein MPL3365_30278 [Mesorhizobium plurifarium]|uniref:Uncharacterized protein n=1 Tax=Mesorhizobium plurifarium TaxID=69974 RepID=A0A090GE87_MESPL|nr:hypothetical protein MPL3365_30278 [Mesorhizobium plurifarium]